MKEQDNAFLKTEQFSEVYDSFMSNIQGGIIVCEYDPLTNASKTVYLSEGWTELTGYSLDELNRCCGGNPQTLVYHGDASRTSQEYIRQTVNSNRYSLEYRIKHKDGHLLWVMDRGVVVASADGRNQNQSIITDITQHKANEEKLFMNEARFRIALNASHSAVFEFDIITNRYSHIENATWIFETEESAVIAAVTQAAPTSLTEVLALWYHPDDISLILNVYENLPKDQVGECEIRVRKPDLSYVWCRLHVTYIHEKDEVPFRIIGNLTNIDSQHKNTERLLKEAQCDPLTGLYNKSTSQEIIKHILLRNAVDTHAMFVLDVDDFKNVNDSMGHLFGDSVLMEVSNKLNRLFRQDDIVGRIGGDEFIVLLKGDISPDDVRTCAESICTAFRHTYSGEKADYKISCSIGIALSSHEDDFDSLFCKADLALYEAKARGKDQYAFYSPHGTDNFSGFTLNPQQPTLTDSGNLKIKERIFELLYASTDLSGSVNMVFSLLGQLLDVSHIYIYENSLDKQYANCIYQWYLPEIKENAQKLLTLPTRELDYFSQFDKNGICNLPDISLAPAPLQKLYQSTKTVSTYQVTIVQEGEIRGFMGFDSLSPMEQTPEILELMSFAAKITDTFIIKKRADEHAKLFNQNKMEALDCLPTAIYVIDPQYNIQYFNNFVKTIHPNIKINQKCHEIFMHNATPCPQCPAKHCETAPCSCEIYNPHNDIWMIANAATIRWSGVDDMRLLCCQVINQYKK